MTVTPDTPTHILLFAIAFWVGSGLVMWVLQQEWWHVEYPPVPDSTLEQFRQVHYSVPMTFKVAGDYAKIFHAKRRWIGPRRNR